jgi:hypothetical protein
MIFDIVKRMLAVFIATALSVIGAGAIVGVNFWIAAGMAGIGGVATVLERLARAYIEDGILSKAEINAAFNSVDSEATIPDAPKAKK